MNQLQIQTSIARLVPEFSGDDTPNRANELTRFICAADSIYGTLGTDEERKIFSKLVKFRLAGEAYTRITYRDVKTYTDLREILNGMYAKTYSLPQTMPQYSRQQIPNQPTMCNYCQRLNHTWDECHIRTSHERNYNHTNPLPYTYTQRYARTTQKTQQKQSHYDTIGQAPTYRQQPLPTQRNVENYRQSNPQQQQNQFTPATQHSQYRPTQRRSRYAPKYRVHCKTTTGHTFEEYRNKFFAKPQIHQTNQNNPPAPPDDNTLTDTINKTRINTIYSHQPQNEDAQYIHPENFKGSDQI